MGVYDRELSDLVYDAKRFILHNRSIIDIAPLQVYYSALLFAPETSLVRKRYLQKIPCIDMRIKVKSNWSSSIQTLEGHTGGVKSVAFSPDGRRVMSGSGDETLMIWDVASE